MPPGQVEKEREKGVPLKSLVAGRGCTKGDGAAPALGHRLVAGSGPSLLLHSPSPASILLLHCCPAFPAPWPNSAVSLSSPPENYLPHLFLLAFSFLL